MKLHKNIYLHKDKIIEAQEEYPTFIAYKIEGLKFIFTLCNETCSESELVLILRLLFHHLSVTE